MVLLLFYDGSKIEISDCEDVVHESGGIVCLDYLGASLATFMDSDIAGYTLNPRVISEISALPPELVSQTRR